MILLFKRLTASTKSLLAWTTHLDRPIQWVPDKKANQPFDLLIDKRNDVKIAGIGNILTHFCLEEEQDLVYWLSSLQHPISGFQMDTMVSRANLQSGLKGLSNLLIVTLLDGTEALARLQLDVDFYQGLHAKVQATVSELQKKASRPTPAKKSGKAKKGQKRQIKPQVKKEKPVAKGKKNKVDPEYAAQLNALSLERWNRGAELETSSEERNVLVTSALPYVNNEPHLGNLIGAVLSADVFARYCRLSGYNTIYICGTDEYGTATEIKALQEGVSPQEICDKYFQIHSRIYRDVGMDFDFFGRTSTPKHREIVQDMYRKCNDAGFIFEETVQQTFCPSCERFLADRYIKAKCPHCQEDAKGDQCDACGKTLEVGDLLNAVCAICASPVEERDSVHLFLDLLKVKPELETFIADSRAKGFWTNNSKSITADWFAKARPRCITRDLSWGVPIPREGFEQKCFYVWFDAPIGYISITANYTRHWRQWWLSDSEENRGKNPVELYQFMGKDNVPFHTIFFPGSQLASREPWTLLKHINTTEYLNYENAKFSKSKGTGVFGSHLRESGIPAEVWRYYLLSLRPEGSDTQFQWDDFQDRNNSELLANLGNFCHRVLKFVYSNNARQIPLVDAALLEETDVRFLKEVWAETETYLSLFEQVKIRASVKSAMKVSSLGNGFAQSAQVWGIKDDLRRRNNKLALLTTLIRLLAGLFEPIMPSWSAKVYFILNFKRDREQQRLFAALRKGGSWEVLTTLLQKESFSGEMNLPVPLFQRIENEQIESFRKKFGGEAGNTAE